MPNFTNMKKYLAILIFTVMAAVGCSSTKDSPQKTDITQIKYRAITRGAEKGVTIARGNINVSETRLGGKNISASYPISVENWNRLVAMAQKADPVKKLGTYEAPSKKHQFDGAMAANLIISVGDTHYSSVTFDDGNPPAEIKALVDEVIGISGLGKIEVQE